MTKGFLEGFVQWLDNNLAVHVKLAENQELLKKGTVYFAPDNYHLEIKRINNQLYSVLTKNPPVARFCPSATVLMRSVAKVVGKNAIGILLTGMGSDGADGLLSLKKAHGHTLVQDKNSSVVFGMASVAISLNAVDKIIDLDELADYLIKLIQKQEQLAVFDNKTE